MQKIYFLVFYFFFLIQPAGAHGVPGIGASSKSKFLPDADIPRPGVTVAGGNGQGDAADQLDNPTGVFVDANGNVYVADPMNARIQKWVPGTSPGVTVAGGNGQGSDANQLANPTDVYLDAAGNIYINDQGNHRIQKWASGASSGTTVAGGNGQGAAANQLSNPQDVAIDAAGNVYVADYDNNRIQKWAPGASQGVTVAGGNGRGTAANQIAPFSVFVDAAGNMYINDGNSCRIQKWAPGATSGITVAGGSCGITPGQILPTDIFVDDAANIYIADQGNNRIQKWAAGATSGVTVAGGSSYTREPSAGELNSPTGVFVDASGNIYVADRSNHRVQKFGAPVVTPNGSTVAGGNGHGMAANQLANPVDVFVDAAGNIYVSDQGNNRIQKWGTGASAGVTVAGGNGFGSGAGQISPYHIFVDVSGNLYIADAANNRIQKWAAGATAGTTVAGGNGRGTLTNQLSNPSDVFVDAAGNMYIADQGNNRIQQWSPGATTGITVAGGNGSGPADNQLNQPSALFVDAAGNIYIADLGNSRIQKWLPRAPAGVTVAGDNGQGTTANQLNNPSSVVVDTKGNIYIADQGNHRIQKWAPGASSGTTVAGGGAGMGADQLTFPTDVFIDANRNIYVADQLNERIQKFTSSNVAYKYYEGDWNTLPNFNALTPVKSGTSGNINISVRPAGVTDHYGFVWQGYLDIKTPGTYTFKTISDDGSRLYFNTPYSSTATPLVNNDGLHGYVPATGTVYIPAAGAYPIAVTYFNKIGATGISVFWSGPGFGEQPIPDLAFEDALKDTTAPAFPANLKVLSVGSSFINLDWDDATDNMAVVGYDVFVNGVRKYTTTASGVTVNDLTDNTAYRFTVIAFDQAGNRSASSATVTGITSVATNTTGGLSYKVYEGEWNVLPNFITLTPVETGNSANIDINVRPAGTEEHFGILWQGKIRITTPGNYTFTTVSDDGSKLYFNNVYSSTATALVNNDGLHGFVPASGNVTIPSTGNYPIAITYFNKTGGKGISVYWSGPGFSQRLIPDSVFSNVTTDTIAPDKPVNVKAVSSGNNFINLDWDDANDNTDVAGYDVYVNGIKRFTTSVSAVTAGQLSNNTSYTFTIVAFDLSGNRSAPSAPLVASTNPGNGLSYKVYQGNWNVLPDFNALSPVKTGTSANIDINVRPEGVEEQFGILWQGYIHISTPGMYTFSTVSDDGSRLYFNTFYNPSAPPLVDNDGLHGYIMASGNMNITEAGFYPIAISFFNKTGGKGISVYWSGPGLSRQLIPDSVLLPLAPGSFTASAPITGNIGEEEKRKVEIRRLYPVPFSDRLTIDFYTGAAASDVRISIRDGNGKTVYTHPRQQYAAGSYTLSIPLSGRPLAGGVYLVTLQVNGVVVKTVPVLKAKR